MKKRILLITRYFPEESGAAVERMRCFAKYLADDVDVTVLTTMPSYPAFKIKDAYRGKFFLKEQGEKENITIYRFWTLQWGKSFVKRLFSDLSFVFGGIFVSLALKKPDKIIVSSPPFFLGFLGLFWKWVRRVPYIFDVRDLYPESLVAVKFLKNKLLIQFLSFFEGLFYRQALAVTTVSYYCAKYIEQKGGMQVTVVYNGIDQEQFEQDAKNEAYQEQVAQYFDSNYHYALYVGNLGRVYDFDVFLDAAKALQHEKIRFLFVGDGWQRDHLERRIKEEKIDNIKILGQQPGYLIPAFISAADVGLLAVKDVGLTRGSIPNKLFEYVAGGIPVFAKIEGEAKNIFAKINNILFFDTKEELLSYIHKVFWGGKIFQKNNIFSRKKEIIKIKSLFDKCI